MTAYARKACEPISTRTLDGGGMLCCVFWLLAILLAYLMGAVPFGLIIGRARGIDIREHGSRNIGATNVVRVLGRGPGAACFALDLLKGALPVIIAGSITGLLGRQMSEIDAGAMILWLGVAAAAVIGHMCSPFIGFRGGKGVATAFGALLGMWPLTTVPALAAGGLWLIALLTTRYVSVASSAAAVGLPALLAVWLIWQNQTDESPWRAVERGWPPLLLAVLLAALVLYRHRTNFARLLRGEEPRISDKRRPPAQ